MFVYAIILALIIGFILRGSLKALGNVDVKGIYLVIIGFGIEAIMHFMVGYGTLKIGTITYLANLLMYILLFVFIYLNRKNTFLLIVGFGFLLNAAAIFTNGGVMPVSHGAMTYVSITQSASSEGLYKVIDSGTTLSFLCDIVPIRLFLNAVVSIGDIISAMGIMLFIITNMGIKKIIRA
jgi:hypothetical protein